jgi:Na+/melibiose symporter-like transporter
LYYSLLSLTAKLGLALGIIYPILTRVGLDPAVRADEATISRVRLVVASAPMLVTICVAIIMWRFPFDRASQHALRAELAANTGAPTPAAAAP